MVSSERDSEVASDGCTPAVAHRHPGGGPGTALRRQAPARRRPVARAFHAHPQGRDQGPGRGRRERQGGGAADQPAAAGGTGDAGATDVFPLRLQIALWIGLILAGPVWLYQLWAFIAPGLHKHERRWAYVFAGLAAPLFAAGAVLAYIVVAKGLAFLLQFTPGNVSTLLEVSGYVKFITNFMLLFGVAFEFPLVVILFNLAGIASARRLLGWWRIAVFVFFAFSAVTVPTADPFGMTAMGLCLTALYFGAVLFAYFNDRRRARAQRAGFGDIGDDDLSPLELDVDPADAGPARPR